MNENNLGRRGKGLKLMGIRQYKKILLTSLLWLATMALAQSQPVEGGMLTFYGRVNHWAESRAELTRELDLMAQVHVDGYMIELSGWGEMRWNGRWHRSVSREYSWLLRQCRKRNLLLFVSIVNDNMGRHKYGDKSPALAEVEDAARKLARMVRKAGAKGVLVQPVAETQTEAGARMEQYCQHVLKDFPLVYNGEGGFPKRLPNGFQFRAVHPSSTHTSVPHGVFAVSDHGKLIRELNADGTLDGLADSTKLGDWIERMQASGAAAIGYYVFQRTQADTTAIKLLGNKK